MATDLKWDAKRRRIDGIVDLETVAAGEKNVFANPKPPDAKDVRRSKGFYVGKHVVRGERRIRPIQPKGPAGKPGAVGVLPIKRRRLSAPVGPDLRAVHKAAVQGSERQPLDIATLYLDVIRPTGASWALPTTARDPLLVEL